MNASDSSLCPVKLATGACVPSETGGNTRIEHWQLKTGGTGGPVCPVKLGVTQTLATGACVPSETGGNTRIEHWQLDRTLATGACVPSETGGNTRIEHWQLGPVCPVKLGVTQGSNTGNWGLCAQ